MNTPALISATDLTQTQPIGTDFFSFYFLLKNAVFLMVLSAKKCGFFDAFECVFYVTNTWFLLPKNMYFSPFFLLTFPINMCVFGRRNQHCALLDAPVAALRAIQRAENRAFGPQPAERPCECQCGLCESEFRFFERQFGLFESQCANGNAQPTHYASQSTQSTAA